MQPNVTVTMISDLSRRVCYPVLMSFGHVKKSHRVIAVLVLMIASLLGLLLLMLGIVIWYRLLRARNRRRAP